MRTILLVIIACALCEVGVQAQPGGNDYHNYLGIEGRFNSRSSNLEGSPYVTETYVPGYIIFVNDYKLEKIALRYNAYEDNIEVKVLGAEYVCKPSDIKEFVYTDLTTKQPVVYKNLKIGGKGASMVEVMHDGKAMLVSRNEMQRGKGKSSGTGYEVLNPVKDVLTLVQKLYIIKNGESQKLARNRKSLTKVLGDHTAELDKFMEDNNIDLKSNEDLLKVMSYYDTL